MTRIVHRDLKASNFMFKRKDDVAVAVAGGRGRSGGGRSRGPTKNQNRNTVGGSNSCNNKTRNSQNLRDLRIIDFGLSTKIDPDTGLVKGCMGTPYYVAPEVLTKEFYDSKCDVWSIGVVAYLILSRDLPFRGKTEQETVNLLMKADEHQPTYDSPRWRSLEPEAIDFCKSLLQTDPSKRPTAREAMSHPWIVKHCGPPPPQRPRINLENTIVVVVDAAKNNHNNNNNASTAAMDGGSSLLGGDDDDDDDDDRHPQKQHDAEGSPSLCSTQSFDSLHRASSFASNSAGCYAGTETTTASSPTHSSLQTSTQRGINMEPIPEIQRPESQKQQHNAGSKRRLELKRWFSSVRDLLRSEARRKNSSSNTTKDHDDNDNRKTPRTRQKTMSTWIMGAESESAVRGN